MKTLAIIACALALGACATTGAALSIAGALSAAGYSVDAYCALSPEARAEVRRKFGINTQLLSCLADEP